MVDFVTGLQAVSAGFNALRELNQVEKEFDKAALKLRIGELSTALATAQITLAEAQSEVAKKDEEISKLKATFKEKQELVEHRGFYYRKGRDGKPRGQPYCPRCLQKGVLMMTVNTINKGHPEQCPECKSEYQGVSTFEFE